MAMPFVGSKISLISKSEIRCGLLLLLLLPMLLYTPPPPPPLPRVALVLPMPVQPRDAPHPDAVSPRPRRRRSLSHAGTPRPAAPAGMRVSCSRSTWSRRRWRSPMVRPAPRRLRPAGLWRVAPRAPPLLPGPPPPPPLAPLEPPWQGPPLRAPFTQARRVDLWRPCLRGAVAGTQCAPSGRKTAPRQPRSRRRLRSTDTSSSAGATSRICTSAPKPPPPLRPRTRPSSR